MFSLSDLIRVTRQSRKCYPTNGQILLPKAMRNEIKNGISLEWVHSFCMDKVRFSEYKKNPFQFQGQIDFEYIYIK